MPARGGRGWGGAVASILFHALVVLLVLLPAMLSGRLLAPTAQGAGGVGPAGGGGGGRGEREASRPGADRGMQFLEVAPAPARPAPDAVVPAPVPVPPPKAAAPVEPAVPPATAAIAPPTPPGSAALSLQGEGGTGNDGSVGTGSGTGGGTGSGTGTGRGTGERPGTGGGPGTIYPPQPINLVIGAMLSAPRSVKPYHLQALFDVDSSGKVLRVDFNRTRDRGFNRRLSSDLAEVRFRPATDWEGRAVRAVYMLGMDAQ